MRERTVFRTILVLILCCSLTLNVFAAVGTVDVQTKADGNEAVDVVITVDSKENADGSTTTQTTTSATDFETESGAVVNYNGVSTETTDKNGVTTGSASSSYTATNGTYEAIGGSESSTEAKAPNGTVSVPVTDQEGSNSNTVVGDEKGTTTTEGDADLDGDYDYTQTTVEQQGSITVTTEKVEMTDNVTTGDSDLDYISSQTTPDGTNDIIKENVSLAPEEFLPGADENNATAPDGKVDGYDFVYVGTGNTSQFRPAIVFTDPLTEEEMVAKFGDGKKGAYIHSGYYASSFIKWLDEEVRATIAKDENGKYVTDEEGFILDKDGNRVLKNEWDVVGPDGETYYLHRVDNLGSNLFVEGWYQDGEWKAELNGSDKYGVVYSVAQQFVLVDQETGEVATVYCADIDTMTEFGFGYNIENLEDADYYSAEQAEQIRAIALNGYWGTAGYELDADGNTVLDANGEPVPAMGSLEAMKAMLLASGQFTAEELEDLTDGVALTATQMAIWTCSNKMQGVEFINSHYFGNPGDTETDGYGSGSNIPESKEAETQLMFKVYEYLMALEPISYEGEETTANTIINKQNFLKDMSLTVVERDETHANNQDADKTNDAYVTELKFALVVTPSTENGDDIIVKIVDASGNVKKEVRIAGTPKDGEEIEYLTADADGNYTISGITLVEGDNTFNISLEGVQNLEEGIYLYSSEVRTDEAGDEVTSQTFVGIASGLYAVNVDMQLTFNVNIEDEIVTTERVWREEGEVELPTPNPNIPGEDPEDPNGPQGNPGTNIPDEQVPMDDGELTEIDEEDVPLADVPQTGDSSVFFIVLAVLSAIGLAAVVLTGKRKGSEG